MAKIIGNEDIRKKPVVSNLLVSLAIKLANLSFGGTVEVKCEVEFLYS